MDKKIRLPERHDHGSRQVGADPVQIGDQGIAMGPERNSRSGWLRPVEFPQQHRIRQHGCQGGVTKQSMKSESALARTEDHKNSGGNIEKYPKGEKGHDHSGQESLPLFGDNGDAVADQCSLHDDASGDGKGVDGFRFLEGTKIGIFPTLLLPDPLLSGRALLSSLFYLCESRIHHSEFPELFSTVT